MFSAGCSTVKVTRREYLALAGTSVAACGRRNRQGYSGFALIATAAESSVSVVDLSTFHLSKQIEVGSGPTMVVAGHDSSYVLTPQTGSVHLLDGLEKRKSSRIAQHLDHLAYAHAPQLVLAMTATGQKLFALDPSSLRPLREWKLSGTPSAIDVSSAGHAAVCNPAEGTVDLIDLNTGGQVVKQVHSPIEQIRFRRDGKLLLVADRKERLLRVLDIPSLETVADLSLAMEPQNLCFKPDGGQLFVSGKGMDGIAVVFPYNTLEVEQTVLAGRDPGVMACSDEPGYLWVASASGSDVCVLNVLTRRVLGFAEVGRNPSFIAVTPDSQFALILNKDSGDMAVIQTASISTRMRDAAKMRGKAAVTLFTMLPVGSNPVHALVIGKRTA